MKWLARYRLIGNRMLCRGGAPAGAAHAPHHGGGGQGPPPPVGPVPGACNEEATLIKADRNHRDRFVVCLQDTHG